MESKNEIRKRIMQARANMSRTEVSVKSDAICRSILTSEAFQKAEFVMCYMDFRNEVKTKDIIAECLRLRKHVALPVVRSEQGRQKLLAYEIENTETDLHTGAYGILEPIQKAGSLLSEQLIDLVIVPGVAFDIAKHRMGYGAGYYDRFLRLLKPGCIRIGVAFDIQLLEGIPTEAHDITMDNVITESRII